MAPRRRTSELTAGERLNFLLTNRIPRRWTTLFVGWLSRRRNPLVRDLSIAIWQFFAGDLRLEEARKARFNSMHDCFIRELKPGARPVARHPGSIVSPCDGIVMAGGRMTGNRLIQAKGFPYALAELLGDEALAAPYQNGTFVTLRLRANMYHRFHAPDACHLTTVRYISGDTWNVNPIAVKCVERLYCRNERAVLPLNVDGLRLPLLLVPVAAIAVASIRIHGLGESLDLRYRGANELPCRRTFARGEEMGYFQQGSTMIVVAGRDVQLANGTSPGTTIRMGRTLLVRSAPRRADIFQ